MRRLAMLIKASLRRFSGRRSTARAWRSVRLLSSTNCRWSASAAAAAACWQGWAVPCPAAWRPRPGCSPTAPSHPAGPAPAQRGSGRPAGCFPAGPAPRSARRRSHRGWPGWSHLCQLAGTEPPLPCHQLVAAIRPFPHRDGLQQTVFPDALGQRSQLLLVKLPPPETATAWMLSMGRV